MPDGAFSSASRAASFGPACVSSIVAHMRTTLIIGAAYCLVIGFWHIAETVAYHVRLDPFFVSYMVAAFVPIFLIAPRSTTPKKRFLFCFTGFIELCVILAFHCRLFVVRGI
jgi:hypothetical protein